MCCIDSNNLSVLTPSWVTTTCQQVLMVLRVPMLLMEAATITCQHVAVATTICQQVLMVLFVPLVLIEAAFAHQVR